MTPQANANADPPIRGYASAYADGVMEATIRYRLDHGLWFTPPPYDWYISHGAIATNDCTEVGQMKHLIAPDGRSYRVLVADCGGSEPHGGAAWMTRNRIIAELDWPLWKHLTDKHGRPLEITLR